MRHSTGRENKPARAAGMGSHPSQRAGLLGKLRGRVIHWAAQCKAPFRADRGQRRKLGKLARLTPLQQNIRDIGKPRVARIGALPPTPQTPDNLVARHGRQRLKTGPQPRRPEQAFGLRVPERIARPFGAQARAGQRRFGAGKPGQTRQRNKACG